MTDNAAENFATGLFIVILVTAFLAIAFVQTCEGGYNHGQIDALEGNVVYESIETPDGTFWYDPSDPRILWESRK